uniref:PPIase cyclophilin-type domain-containing protein n=1 Tax=Homalodisca liturata TaxID=320908 RepID=A0A1B6HXX2_9HEMI
MPKSRVKSPTFPVALKVNGLILSESYQKCKIYVEKLRKYHRNDFLVPSVKGFLEVDWLEYLSRLRKGIGGQTWAVTKGVVVFVDGIFIGGEEELFSRFCSVYKFKLPGAEAIRAAAKKEYLHYLDKENLIYVYFEIAVSGKFAGTMLFELRADMLPKTSTWFALHCDPSNHMGYSYKGSSIHRICKSGWFQAGRDQVYNPKFMEDESFCYKHDRRGILSFANEGKCTNRTEFFVTFKPSMWMDQYYVAFGRMVEGSSVLNRIENTKCTYETPDDLITIEDCGLAKVGMGKRMPEMQRMKGLTIGEPHIDPETFMDLIFEKFCAVLFERLDTEVKFKFHQQWIGEMLWERVHAVLYTKIPPPDVLDLKDRSSKEYFMEHYLAGLYGLRDIPDHYIHKILNQLVEDAVERSGIIKMAESIVELILDLVKKRSEAITQGMVDDLVEYVINNVYRIVFGQDEAIDRPPQEGMISKSLSKVLSEIKYTETTVNDLQSTLLQGSELEGHSSTKKIVVEYIWESLLNFLENKD